MEEEESYGKSPVPEDMVHDEDTRYDSDDEHVELKQKEKPAGPPLELEVPFRPAPAHPAKVYLLMLCPLLK